MQVAFLPDGARAYVTLRDDNAVAVIDTRTPRVLATIPAGRGPIQLIAAAPSGAGRSAIPQQPFSNAVYR